MVVPGRTKHTARVLMFDPRSQTMGRVRDLVHRKHWVLGAYLGQKQEELKGGKNCFLASYSKDKKLLFMKKTNFLVSTCPANTGKYSYELDTSLPWSAVTYFALINFNLKHLFFC